MIGPALFVATFTLVGWMRPDYNAYAMLVSELALGPGGWIQCVNFIVCGVLCVMFARGIAVEFPDGRASTAGPLLLTIIGYGLLLSGFFLMDPVNTLAGQRTLHGKLHDFFGGVPFSLSPVSCLVFMRRFHVDPKWRSLQWWTLAVGLTPAAVLVVLLFIRMQIATPNPFAQWEGLIQRTVLIPYLAWQFAFAAGLRTRSTTSGTTHADHRAPASSAI
jgi:phosphatidylserine synthase